MTILGLSDSALLNVIFTNRPSLVSKTTTIPGLSDHDIVLCGTTLQPAKVKPFPHTVHILAKADIPQKKKDTDDFTAELVYIDSDAALVEVTWNHIHDALLSIPKNNVP